ncbi:hypothetical protein [Nonomuraea sp. NPDC049141]|uniref:hypothetical protein n=1 Tax=Nonomuraea sp. NPDC049141 TaxID=3155500 RepID=UPI0033F5C7DE
MNEQTARALHKAGLAAESGVLARHTGHERGYGEAADGWWVERERTTAVAGEVVSPILRDTPETWSRVDQVVEIIRAHGGEPGPGVGGHIHVGTPDYREVINYLKLLDAFRGHQDILYRLAQNPAAEGGLHRGYEYCMPNVARPGLRPYHFQALIDANGPTNAVSMASVRGRADDHLDKEQLISLYAITGWQPSVLARYSQEGGRP